MKTTQNTVAFILTAILIHMLSVNTSYSQSTNISYRNPEKFWIGLSVNPAVTGISVTNDSLKTLKTTSKNSIGFSAEAGYMFSKNLGVSIGAGLLTCSSEYLLDAYKQWYNATDTEGDPYNRLVTGANILQEQKISFLAIPVKLNISVPLGEKFGLFLNPGITMLFPVSKKYSGSGTFSYSGYYAAYDILITDVSWEGFLPDQSTTASGITEVKSFVPSMTLNAGLNYRASDRIKVALGVVYFQTISSVSASVPYKDFHLSSDINKMGSLISVSNSSLAKATGICLSLIYSIGQ